MIRRIITIDEQKCNGCGLCAAACHEGAIGIVDGKARLLRESYCDGLGDCLPACPSGAITFIQREAPAYDRQAVLAAQPAPEACPEDGQLKNFPVQLKLVPAKAPWYDGGDLLIAADCTAFAYSDFQKAFVQNRITLIGCPKLDGIFYGEKLREIFAANAIRSIILTRMQVPCCGGLVAAVRTALEACGKQIPCQVITIGPDGQILSRQSLS